ncbi:MAG: PQQ-binding-like beta-propeller repeat protein [Terracidiphilus sp.]
MARCFGFRGTIVYLILLSAFAASAITRAQENPGAAVYAKRCAFCHDKTAVRMPTRSVLQQRSAAFILKTLNAGVMKAEAASLSDAERAQVAGWLGRKTALGLDTATLANSCRVAAAPAASSGAPSWISWGGDLENQRFQPAATAGLGVAQAVRLKVKWAFGIPDASALRSQPVVFGGNLLFGGGTVLYSLDAASGCTHWATELPSAIRSGIAMGSPANKPLAFFGDAAANVYAVDAATGAPVWQVKLDPHPAAMVTGTPAYDDGRLYVPVSSFEELAAVKPGYTCCTFRGSVVALDAATGKILWQTYTIDRPASEARVSKLGVSEMGPSGAAVWSTPTIDAAAHVLYAVTGDNYSDPPTDTSDALFVLDLATGKVEWSHQFRAGDAWNVSCVNTDAKNCPDANGPDYDFGASPILLSRPGGKRVLILAQKSGAVYALDPDHQGKLLWQSQVGRGGSLGGVEWGPATDRERLYAAVSDESFLADGSLDPDKGGGLFALSLKTGAILWNTPPSPCAAREKCSPAQTAAVTAIPGVVFSASLNGHIRAYAARDGKVLWDFNTVRDFKTVNGVPAHGGSISVAGPVIAAGTVYVLSGYDTFGESSGNVLLAFSPDGN